MTRDTTPTDRRAYDRPEIGDDWAQAWDGLVEDLDANALFDENGEIDTANLSDDAITAAKIAAAAVDSGAIASDAVGVDELADALGTSNGSAIPGTTHFKDTEHDSVNTGQASIGPNARDWGDRIDLFAVGGQSNAEGRGDAAQSPDVSGVALEYDTSDDSLSTANDPVGDADTGSAWPAFARRYYERTGRAVVFVESAEGGASQHTGAGSPTWDTDGDLRSRLVSHVNSAEEKLKTQGYNPHFRGILWSQGERDAQAIDDGGITKSDYKTALEGMLSYFDGEFSDPWEFYVLQTGKNNAGDTDGYEAVRGAQREVTTATNNAIIASALQAGFSDRGLMADSLHYDQTGLNLMGRTAADRIASSGRSERAELVSRYQNAAQSLPNDSAEVVQFDGSEDMETGVWLDFQNRLRATEPGVYNVDVAVTMYSPPDGASARAMIEVARSNSALKNYAGDWTHSSSSSNFLTPRVSRSIRLEPGDELRFITLQRGGATSVNTLSGNQWTYFSAALL